MSRKPHIVHIHPPQPFENMMFFLTETINNPGYQSRIDHFCQVCKCLMDNSSSEHTSLPTEIRQPKLPLPVCPSQIGYKHLLKELLRNEIALQKFFPAFQHFLSEATTHCEKGSPIRTICALLHDTLQQHEATKYLYLKTEIDMSTKHSSMCTCLSCNAKEHSLKQYEM